MGRSSYRGHYCRVSQDGEIRVLFVYKLLLGIEVMLLFCFHFVVVYFVVVSDSIGKVAFLRVLAQFVSHERPQEQVCVVSRRYPVLS